MRIEPFTLRRSEDDVQYRTLFGGELGLDQVGRPLRIRSGDVELVPQVAPHRAHEHDQTGHDADPCGDHTPWMCGEGSRPAR